MPLFSYYPSYFSVWNCCLSFPVLIPVYGCFTHLRIFHQTDGPAWMNHCTYCPGNGFSTVIICHQHASTTQRIDPGLCDHLRPHTCALPLALSMHVSLEHKMAGAQAVGQSNTVSSSAAGAYYPYQTEHPLPNG